MPNHSDSQDSGFQQLDQKLDQINVQESIVPDRFNTLNNQNLQPKPHIPKKKLKIFKLQIIQSQNKIDMNILQNQFYHLKLYEKQKLIKQNVQRRYSDFDLLFQILQRKYPGFIFPAFPQKGIFSYVKTKVTVTKDQQFLKKRVKIIQRFFNSILNEEKFNPNECTETKKFFSKDEQYEIFKQTNRQEINKSKSIVDSTWGVIKDFFKMNQTNKYTVLAEQIKKEKLPFEEMLTKTQQLSTLINDQIQANKTLCQFESQNRQKCHKFIPAFADLRKRVQNYTKLMQPVQKIVSDIEFELQCQNQDYLMILKKIELIEQMKQSQQNYKNLSAIETEFINKRNEIQFEKSQTLQKLKNDFRRVVSQINKIERGEQ